MTQLSKIEAPQAEWLQPKSGERKFELWANDALLGKLSFRSSSGTLALTESAYGNWTFKRIGFMNPRITIRSEGLEENLAEYKSNLWGHGVLTFKDGRSYAWKPSNFWGTAWGFNDAEAQTLLRFNPGIKDRKFKDIFKNQATADIDPRMQGDEKLPILLGFGLYLLLMHEEDSTAAITAAIS